LPQGIGVARLFDAPVDVVAPAENAQVGAPILVLCTLPWNRLGAARVLPRAVMRNFGSPQGANPALTTRVN
jgi:hypothetical protein